MRPETEGLIPPPPAVVAMVLAEGAHLLGAGAEIVSYRYSDNIRYAGAAYDFTLSSGTATETISASGH